MKVVSVRKMEANWAEIERQVAMGETFEVLNPGKTGSATVNLDREGAGDLYWDAL